MLKSAIHARARVCGLLIWLVIVLAPIVGSAQGQAPTSPDPEAARTQERIAAWNAATKAAAAGPAQLPLLDQAHLRLPANMIFVPPSPAARLLRSWGNTIVVDPVGLVIGTRDEDQWATVVRFVKDGYIKDDDAKDWNADQMLDSIRNNNDEVNKDRLSRGFPEQEIIGWIAPPRYDPATHRLVSSLAQRAKDAPADAVQGINFITYALGRDGYFSLEMLTNQSNVGHDKLSAAALFAGLDYDAGHRYTDFNASTDHVAAYGLAALVGVVAAKKLGLLALAGVFALKFAKLGALAVAGAGAIAARAFKRKSKAT